MIQLVDTTPELPPEIRDFTDPEETCTNVYEILPNETKLYGTESLVDEKGVIEPTWKYGYWKTAELLLLAQDPSNLKTIQKRCGDGHPDPFCAFDWRKKKDGFETNRISTGSLSRLTAASFMEASSLVCLNTPRIGAATP